MLTLTFSAEEAIQKMAEETGIEQTLIREKMNEKITKFSGLLTEQGALVLISKELNAKSPLGEQPNAQMKLGNIKPGMNNVDVRVQVARADGVKTYNKNGKEGKYASIRLQDETGEALFTFWNEQADEAFQKGLAPGCTLLLSNARGGVFNGQLQLSLGYNGTYTIEKGTTPVLERKTETIPFSQLTENAWTQTKASVVDVLPGKGYYVRCNSCLAKLQYRDTICPQCGKEGSVETRLLVSLLLDDGTATLRGVAFEKEAIALFGKTKEEILTAMDDEKTKNQLWQHARGSNIEVKGKGKKGMDASSIELVVQEIKPLLFQNE